MAEEFPLRRVACGGILANVDPLGCQSCGPTTAERGEYVEEGYSPGILQGDGHVRVRRDLRDGLNAARAAH